MKAGFLCLSVFCLFLTAASSSGLWDGTQRMSFSRDDRPLDGSFRQVLLEKDSDGLFSASLRIIASGYPPPVEDVLESLGAGFICKSYQSANIICVQDTSYNQGIELYFSTVSTGHYNATMMTNNGVVLLGANLALDIE